MLTRVILKAEEQMRTSLAEIETGGLPDTLITEVRDYFMQYAGTQKALNGVDSVLRGAIRIVKESGVTDAIYQDFLTKREIYVASIIEGEEDTQAAIDLFNMHKQ